MKEIALRDALNLTQKDPSPAVSIYLRTDHHDRDGELRIKSNLHSLYRSAEALIQRTYTTSLSERLLRPLRKAIEGVRISRGHGGIAIYHTENFTRIARLPTAVPDLAVAAESFHIKPVLRCLQLRRNYYLLCLKKKHADLVLVTPDGTKFLERIEVSEPEKPDHHFANHPRAWFKDRIKVRRKKDVRLAMEQISKRLESYFHNERFPILLAGSQRLQDEFRKVCTYINILEQGIVGYIDDLEMNSIVRMANQMMERVFAGADDLVIVNFLKARSQGLTSENLEKIAAAAARGQVQHLLISEDRHVWGHLDRESGEVEVLKSKQDALSDDLLDDIAELTLSKGGKVTVLPSSQMPRGLTIAGIFRWRDPGENDFIQPPAMKKVEYHASA